MKKSKEDFCLFPLIYDLFLVVFLFIFIYPYTFVIITNGRRNIQHKETKNIGKKVAAEKKSNNK